MVSEMDSGDFRSLAATLACRQEIGIEITKDNYMGPLRILLLGPDCHPERVSIPRVTYYHAAALAQTTYVTLVARSSVEAHSASLQARRFAPSRWSGRQLSDQIGTGCFAGYSKYNYESQARLV